MSTDGYIETPRLLIRKPRVDQNDAEFLVKLWNTPEFLAGGDTGVNTTEKALSALKGICERFDKYGHGIYIIEDRSTHQPIGSVSLMRGDFTAPDIGFALLSGFMGKGYAKEAGLRMIDYATSDLNYPGVFGFSNPKNEKSRKVQEALGLEYRGTLALEAFGGDETAIFAMKGMGELKQYGISAD